MKLSAKIQKSAALKRVLRFMTLSMLLLAVETAAKPDWYQRESDHFAIVYRQSHAYLVPHILQSAENAFAKLAGIFNHPSAEKIVLMTSDFTDYGSAGAITVPQNFIRLDIAPFELGYENIPYHDRMQWLMNHELVHIFVNDQASKAESFSRSLFSKVAPEQDQPLSVCYSLLTNHSRYTPRWHQEGIAVFLETWLSGGFGRVLGSFDEMYFRSLVIEGKPLAAATALETKTADESFLLGTLHYLYGARFMAHLAARFGAEELLAWFRIQPGEFYNSFEKKFEKIFGLTLQPAWQDFIRAEIEFQQTNIAKLSAAPPTPITRLREKPLGWVTQPHVDDARDKIIFGYHHPHQLTTLSAVDLKTHGSSDFGTLPTPCIIQIASTAYDPALQLLFYTTNNNNLFRDIRVRNLTTGDSKILFKDVRAGELTVASKTHELWGIRHAAGKATLVYSAHPYERLAPVVEFEFGDELQHLAASPSGRFLAGTLHQANGRQAIIVANLDQLKENGRFFYQTISDEGSPEFPSWSPDESYLYWNAFTNGVSNIYRVRSSAFKRNLTDAAETPEGVTTNSFPKIEAMSHTQRGLFRPVYLSADSLFAFEFSSEGFIPVVIANRPAAHLPAIQYFGQTVIDRNPYLTQWTVQSTKTADDTSAANYDGLSQLKVQSLLPVISGFQDQPVIGLYTHFGDPLNVHDITIEAGLSNFNQRLSGAQYHLKGRYEFKRKYHLEFEHNAPSFYDLFNQRKAGFEGAKLTLGHTRYLKFDEPHKIKQTANLSLYHGLKAIHDNTVVLSQSDFATIETTISSRNVRRAIGSVDSEFGDTWSVTMSAIGTNPKYPQLGVGIHAEWGRFHTWLMPHNVLHVKVAGGIFHGHDDLAFGKFYFGGFGNQLLENKEVKQYRDVFRFPGIPAYSLDGRGFAKLMIENNLPPLRLRGVGIGSHFLNHIDASLFTQILLIGAQETNAFGNLGGQVNLVFNHWLNLESTVSAGVARAWPPSNSGREWFVSLKLLKN